MCELDPGGRQRISLPPPILVLTEMGIVHIIKASNIFDLLSVSLVPKEVSNLDNLFLNHAKNFKALSDDLRLNILFYLYQNNEKCVCSLSEYFGTAQSALSYHLKILTDNELLIKRQDAVWNFYSINKKHFMFSVLEQMFESMAQQQLPNDESSKKAE